MANNPITYFGIDLGTTYSAISYIDETGRPSVIRDPMTNEETVPSAVYFENASNVLVGGAAKEVSRLYPERVVSLVKRQMGKQREWDFDGQTHTPESISALVLKQLAQSAADATGRQVRDVVITVPAYFGQSEKEATRHAGIMAGLNVIGIVPEPVAAALHYDLVSGSDEKLILVFDLGGGTFDTTVIRISDTAITVICTDGDQELGGADWDTELTAFVLKEFLAGAMPDEDPSEDAQFMQELQLNVEKVKHALSQAQSRQVPLRFGAASHNVQVTREAFEERTEHLVDRTIHYTERTLATLAAKIPGAVLDDVLLVGGSTIMPMIAERLRTRFGWDPKLHDPHLAVAKGAARYALAKSVWREADETTPGVNDAIETVAVATGLSAEQLRSVASKSISNVLPKAFGIKLIDDEKRRRVNPRTDAEYDSVSYIKHLVHANDTVPTPTPIVLNAATVADKQSEVEVEIWEQAGSSESPDLADNKKIQHDRGVISGLPPLPAGSPVNVTMEVDGEGMLTVRGVEPASGKELTIEVRVAVLSDEQVASGQRMVSGLSVRS